MRAAVARAGVPDLQIEDWPDPRPGPGHVLARTLACGICGSDLHAAADLRRFAALSSQVGGGPAGLDPEAGVVFGHEFCAEIIEFGPGTEQALPIGAAVCSVPVVLGQTGPQPIGYSNDFPGGLAELLVLQEALLLPVPEGTPPHVAALTEPLAVGEHAVGLAGLQGGEVCLVLGCGPIGLAVIAALKARGAGPVLAADFSPARRQLAELLGADEVIDPAQSSPYGRWSDLGIPAGVGERAAMEMFGATFPDAVVFEAVGVPGMLQAIIEGSPARARVVVVGVCMDADTIQPFAAVAKELDLRFSFGYSPAEYATTLERLAGGVLPAERLITATLPLEGTPGAFKTLAQPGEHGKIIVQP